MAKTEKYATEDPKHHFLLLTVLHTYANHHSRELVEIDYHKIPIHHRVIYKLRPYQLTSTYHLLNTTIQHITGEEDKYISFTGKSKKTRDKAKVKLERMTNIDLNPLEIKLKAK